MKHNTPYSYSKMKHIANILLREPPVITGGFRASPENSSCNDFDYAFESECEQVHFMTELPYLQFIEDNGNHSQIVVIKVSENVFKENFRYICCRFNNSPFMDCDEMIRHYDYSNYEYDELCAKIKILYIIPQLNFDRIIENPLSNAFFDQSVIIYQCEDEYELRKLFSHMGYCNEQIETILSTKANNKQYVEPLAFYFRVAIRLLYDEDIQVNHIGRKILNHLLLFQI